MTTPAAVDNATTQRPDHRAAWFARLSLLAALAVIVDLVVGSQRPLGIAIAVAVGLAAVLAGGWWYISRTGPVRWLAAAVILAAPTALLIVCIVRGQLLEVLVSVAAAAVAVIAGRAAAVRLNRQIEVPQRETSPPLRPYLIMNPKSGGGKTRLFELDTKAAALGAEVALLEGPGIVDVAALAKGGVKQGADLLGVAGGDGTQALVAAIAAEHDLPFLVLSAGTRNHFALDLGLDRERPDTGLDALADGVELCVDLGFVAGRAFVNNASFGAYAEVVQSPAYRDDKRGTALQLLPDLLTGRKGPRLVVRLDDNTTIEGPQALLVSNNPYGADDLAGLGRRPQLNTGTLGVVAVRVNSAAQAVALLRRGQQTGVQRCVAREVIVDADADAIAVGIDGEAVMLPTPVRCTIHPAALRVRVPRHRPGVPTSAHVDLGLLVGAALTH